MNNIPRNENNKKQLQYTYLKPRKQKAVKRCRIGATPRRAAKQTSIDIQIRRKTKSFHLASSYPKQNTNHGLFTEQPLTT